jgi:hypothetical protein
MVKLMPLGSESDNLVRGCDTTYAPGHLQVSRDNMNKTVTFVSFSPSGNELLVNYGVEQIYLFEIDKGKPPIYLSFPKHFFDIEIVDKWA